MVLNVILITLNKINLNYANSDSITIISLTHSKESEEDNDITIIQKTQNIVNRAIKNFRKLNPALSDKRITIRFYIRQFRTIALLKERTNRGRAAYTTL